MKYEEETISRVFSEEHVTRVLDEVLSAGFVLFDDNKLFQVSRQTGHGPQKGAPEGCFASVHQLHDVG